MDVLNKTIQKTRKDHKCFGCCGTIPKGSKVEKITTFDGGSALSSYWCNWCLRISILLLHEHGIEEYYDDGEVMERYNETPELFKEIGPRSEYKKSNVLENQERR